MESLVVFYIGVPYRVCVLHRGSLQMEPLVVFYREGRLEPAVGIKLAQSPGLIHTPAHQLNVNSRIWCESPILKCHRLCMIIVYVFVWSCKKMVKMEKVLAPQVGCSVQRIFVGAWSMLAVIPFETTTDNMPERTHVPWRPRWYFSWINMN